MDLPAPVAQQGHVPVNEPLLRSIIDALWYPAFIITCRDGKLRHANPAARRVYPTSPRWLRACACGVPGMPARWLRGVHVETESEPLDLVFPALHTIDPTDAHQSVWAERWSLPPRLARVASHLLRGDSDKEIAARLGLEFHTVRTYIKTLYRKVGVHSRSELVQKILAASGLFW